MSTALALRLDHTALIRGALAGTAWGLTMSAAFFGLALWQCGMPCPDDVVMSTLACVATGLIAIGPLAAFRRDAAS